MTGNTLKDALDRLSSLLERHRLLFLHSAEAMRRNPGAPDSASTYEQVSKLSMLGFDQYVMDIGGEGEFLLRHRRFLDTYAEKALNRFGYGVGKKPDSEGAAFPCWQINEGSGNDLENSADKIIASAASAKTLDVENEHGELISRAISATHDQGCDRWYSGVSTRWEYLMVLDSVIAGLKRAAAISTSGSSVIVGSSQSDSDVVKLLEGDVGTLKQHVDELLWAVKLVSTLPASLGEHQARTYRNICARMEGLSNCLKEFYQRNGREHYVIKLLRRVHQSLEVVGYDGTQCPDWENLQIQDDDPYAPTTTPDVPINTINMLEEVVKVLVDFDEQDRLSAEAAIEKDRAEILKAQAADCFIEYVRRHPGKGVLLSVGPIESYEGTADFDMGPEYTTCVEIAKYPGDRWVRWTERHHCEAGKLDDEVDEIDEVTAAREILESDVQVDVETVVWAKLVCDQNPGPIELPEQNRDRVRWDRDNGKLFLDDKVVRAVRGSKVASNVVKVLDAFHEDGWPERIDSPFPDDEAGKERMRETIRSLNTKLELLQFSSDGNGMGILVRIPARPDTSLVSPEDFPF